MVDEDSNDRYSLEPSLTYSDDREIARLRASGIELKLNGPVLELAAQHDGLEMSRAIPHMDMESLYGADIGTPLQVTVTIEPVEDLDGR